MPPFKTGKLPPEFLGRLLSRIPRSDPRVIRSAGIGEDAAVIESGGTCLVATADPVTFAADRPGWYAVQVNANDIAVTGGVCRWFLATLLLPEGGTDEALVDSLFEDILTACRELGVQLVGGHTEITPGLTRPVVAGQMLGEVSRKDLCSMDRVRPGDSILLTRALAVEGTALIAREHGRKLAGSFSAGEIERAADFLFDPGISVVREAAAAAGTGLAHAMHDPTEGGLAGALREMAAASGAGLVLYPDRVPVYPETRRFCKFLGLDPLGLIASGSLLVACPPEGERPILEALAGQNIPCARIGEVVPREEGLTEVEGGRRRPLRSFGQDEFCRIV
jgi:hydrogenase expression/formation protein HypE